MHAEATKHVQLGRKSLGCPAAISCSGGDDLGGEQTGGPEHNEMLESLCRVFHAPPDIAKLKYVPGPITPEKIRYCRQDVKATLWALNTLAAEFLGHPIDLAIDRAYSPVSLAKSYLEKMNIIPPQEKFNIPSEFQAAAMEAFYAGRAEARIRK